MIKGRFLYFIQISINEYILIFFLLKIRTFSSESSLSRLARSPLAYVSENLRVTSGWILKLFYFKFLFVFFSLIYPVLHHYFCSFIIYLFLKVPIEFRKMDSPIFLLKVSRVIYYLFGASIHSKLSCTFVISTSFIVIIWSIQIFNILDIDSNKK